MVSVSVLKILNDTGQTSASHRLSSTSSTGLANGFPNRFEDIVRMWSVHHE
eukprot:gene11033-19644_t